MLSEGRKKGTTRQNSKQTHGWDQKSLEGERKRVLDGQLEPDHVESRLRRLCCACSSVYLLSPHLIEKGIH